jgi:hypothetical protein
MPKPAQLISEFLSSLQRALLGESLGSLDLLGVEMTEDLFKRLLYGNGLN